MIKNVREVILTLWAEVWDEVEDDSLQVYHMSLEENIMHTEVMNELL